MNNLTLFQFFHWYYSIEGNLWQHGVERAPHLAHLGVTHVWLPPAYKSSQGANEPGYSVYDLFDLGEFDQKGSIRTRYGTKEEYLACIEAFHKNDIGVLADIVLNHKNGADETEEVPVHEVYEDNRLEKVEDEEQKIDAWTKFLFPGRQGKYSTYVWDWHSFTGVCKDDKIYLILNEYANGEWDEMIEDEKGNFDFLLGADIEFRNPNVRQELKYWGEWYVNTTNVDGFRLDALKHIHHSFFPEWLAHLNEKFSRNFLCIGEYWRNSVEPILKYIELTEGKIQLFDAPLHFNFHQASMQGNDYDMRNILKNSVLEHRPELSITFVDNHDTQPLQSLQSPVDYWFKPHAYALILLREQGIPCVFYPAMYGAKYSDWEDGQEVFIELNSVNCLEAMMLTRKLLSYGMQRDYFDHANTIGWTREGIDEKEFSGCAVVMTNGSEGFKTMEVGKRHAGKTFVDICGCRGEKIVIDENGFADFPVNERSACVWVREEAIGLFAPPQALK